MKQLAKAIIGSVWLLGLAAGAQSTIDPANSLAWVANIGWLNFQGDGPNGAVIGQYYCAGAIYSPSVGWISLGNGAPTNGMRYQNNAANDFGVNTDSQGNLRGFAYGANVGWINFEDIGGARVDLMSGQLSGFAYGANVGWISLSNAVASVKTLSLSAGARDTNGLPIAWEMQYFRRTGVDPNADADGDGISNFQEFLAGTDPGDAQSGLTLRGLQRGNDAAGEYNSLSWASIPTRLYNVWWTTNLSARWTLYGPPFQAGPGGATSRTLEFSAPADSRFFRIEAVRPLPF